MQKEHWGKLDGKDIELFTLDLGQGCQAGITNFGGALVSLLVPDAKGQLDDVILGYDNFAGYQNCTKSMGILVGRHANRIEDAQFTLDGVSYKLNANDGKNHLHGGPGGFGKRVWDSEIVETKTGKGLKLSYFSPHAEEGYPGNLQVEVTYSPISGGGIRLDYWAEADQDTVVNLTNHAYFNLAGQGQGLILDHDLQLLADFFTPINSEGVPTGEVFKVAGTPLDFRSKTPIGQGIDANHPQIQAGQGYDHNWIIQGESLTLKKAARVEHAQTKRALEVWTTKPGIQFYSGNFLDDTVLGKQGVAYPKRSGFCLETQYFPNSLRFPHFQSAILPAKTVYQHSTIYQFSVLD